ncbi:28 kDa heat- and acid-stable phosphoprotein-like [Plodia interpunctella]|uniref:28 kDa heat- and acid-stable phosphoprotein-like n=1 Tax=Plodia interpunctella TaxID=58824 RepID=UPI0023689BE2|nr:28 kDa heat- and acid-stable phosphoprotein-like [Plodia interpunctella]
MPRGKYTNHKGRNRKFTSPEELEEQRKQEELKQKWRKEHGGESSSEEESADDKSGSGSSEDSDSEGDHPVKAKGVSGLIEVENPNRVVKKNKKLTTLNTLGGEGEKPQLSRREREEIERQRAAAAYQRAHAEGRTEQARADLARLAIIRQQREEAAKRRELEKKAKDDVPKKR